ncbi:MAG: ABC transporter ATP-binding protein [Bacteroidales bacterium]|nr:ABC transporter ATP-binding protein [Bacteroidales bacterium]
MAEQSFIEITGLTKWYKNTTVAAVDQLNLNIDEGEIFGLLGPNGAGKTTTLSILCNQIPFSGGDISINGFSLKRNAMELKKIIGVVPQEIALYDKLTAFENLRFFGNLYGLKGNFLKSRIADCMVNFGLEGKLNKKIDTFSGGMKRRVNLIAGILHKPRILFLDEPTVGIDVQSKTVIIDYLKELNKEGTTILYTSHHMDEAEHFCTRIAIIDQGKIIAKGAPSEMIKLQKGCESLEDIFLHLTGRKLRD